MKNLKKSHLKTTLSIVLFLFLALAFRSNAQKLDGKKTKMPIYVSQANDIKFPESSATKLNGTAQADGEKSIILYGDPKKANLYTVLVYIPAGVKINPVTHPDDGFVTVLSGTWYVGFGDDYDASKLTKLTTGGVYTEPSNTLHFGETRDEPCVLSLTRFGPSGTIYGKKSTK